MMDRAELREISLNVLDTQIKNFFTIKMLTDKIISVKLGIPETEVMRTNRYNDMKDSISEAVILAQTVYIYPSECTSRTSLKGKASNNCF